MPAQSNPPTDAVKRSHHRYAPLARLVPPAPPAGPFIALKKKDAARALGVSVRTITRRIASGEIIARHLGGRTLVDADSLRAYFNSLPQAGRHGWED